MMLCVLRGWEIEEDEAHKENSVSTVDENAIIRDCWSSEGPELVSQLID